MKPNRKDVNVMLTGVEIKSAVGVLTVSGGANVPLTGVNLKVGLGEITAKGEIRTQLWVCQHFKKPYTRSLGLVLTSGSDGHTLSPEDIVDVLDNQVIPAPHRWCKPSCDTGGCEDWTAFYRKHPKTFWSMVAHVRADLEEHGIPHAIPIPHSTGN